MDHDHGDGGITAVATATCKTIMVFHGGHCERILFKGWVASTLSEFLWSCVALFFMAIFYEALKFVREYLYKKAVQDEKDRIAQEIQAKNYGTTSEGDSSNLALATIKHRTLKEKMFNTTHVIQTLLNIVQVTISYLLMLVFMNFNYWLCLSMWIGLAVGFYFFGWMKQASLEKKCYH